MGLTSRALEKLGEFVYLPEQEEFLWMAHDSMLGEVGDEVGFEDSETLEKMVGSLCYGHMISPAILAFMASNRYCEGSEDPSWNLVDRFLETDHGLGPVDVAFLKDFRDSYMSLYRVEDVFPGEAVVLTDMMTPKPAERVEESTLKGVAKGDVIGARLCAYDGVRKLMAPLLKMDPEDACELAKETRELHEMTLAYFRSKRGKRDVGGNVAPEMVEQLTRALWAKEIFGAWLLDQLMMLETEKTLKDVLAKLERRRQKPRKAAAKAKKKKE